MSRPRSSWAEKAALFAALALLLPGCGKKPDAKPQEVRRYSGEAGDRIVYQGGKEVVLAWRWVLKPIEDEVAR